MELGILLAFGSMTLLIALAGFFMGLNAIIDVKAMERSTHTMVQNFKPIEDDLFDDELEKEVDTALKTAEDKFFGLRSEPNDY